MLDATRSIPHRRPAGFPAVWLLPTGSHRPVAVPAILTATLPLSEIRSLLRGEVVKDARGLLCRAARPLTELAEVTE